MRSGAGVGGVSSGQRRDFDDQVQFVVEAERLRVDFLWTAEAWGQGAIVPLAFIAARTSRIKLGTVIMQISARAPVLLAMTALTVAAISWIDPYLDWQRVGHTSLNGCMAQASIIR